MDQLQDDGSDGDPRPRDAAERAYRDFILSPTQAENTAGEITPKIQEESERRQGTPSFSYQRYQSTSTTPKMKRSVHLLAAGSTTAIEADHVEGKSASLQPAHVQQSVNTGRVVLRVGSRGPHGLDLLGGYHLEYKGAAKRQLDEVETQAIEARVQLNETMPQHDNTEDALHSTTAQCSSIGTNDRDVETRTANVNVGQRLASFQTVPLASFLETKYPNFPGKPIEASNFYVVKLEDGHLQTHSSCVHKDNAKVNTKPNVSTTPINLDPIPLAGTAELQSEVLPPVTSHALQPQPMSDVASRIGATGMSDSTNTLASIHDNTHANVHPCAQTNDRANGHAQANDQAIAYALSHPGEDLSTFEARQLRCMGLPGAGAMPMPVTPPYFLTHQLSGERSNTDGPRSGVWDPNYQTPWTPSVCAKPPSYEDCVKYQAKPIHLADFSNCEAGRERPPPPVYQPGVTHPGAGRYGYGECQVIQAEPNASSASFTPCRSIDRLYGIGEAEPMGRGRNARARPKMNSVFESDVTSILAFLGCLMCWPVGLVAIYYSYLSKVYKQAGNLAQARAFGKSAFVCAIAAILVGGMSLFTMYVYKRRYFGDQAGGTGPLVQ